LAQMRRTPKTTSEYRAWADAQFGSQASEFLKLYPAESDGAVAGRMHDVGRDSTIQTHWTWARLHTKTGKSKAYLYLFSHVAPVPSVPGVMPPVIGAIHFSDLIYVFNNLRMKDSPWTETDRSVADITSSYWVNFVKTGDPNGPGLPVWPIYDPRNEQLMNIADIPHMEAVPDRAGVEFLAAFEERLRNAALHQGHAGN